VVLKYSNLFFIVIIKFDINIISLYNSNLVFLCIFMNNICRTQQIMAIFYITLSL